MTVIFYYKSDIEQNFNSDTWIDVASKSGFLNAQAHWLWGSCEYGGLLTNREVEIRILVNEVETDYDYHTPEKTNGYKKFVAFGQLTPLVDDSEYTIKLQVKGGNTAQTINTRRIRFMVMQE